MALNLRLRQLVSREAGVYFIVTDNTVIPEIEADSKLRLIPINSVQGPVNTVFIFARNDVEGFTSIFGRANRPKEKQGNFSHSTVIDALSVGPVAVVNLRTFDADLDTTSVATIATSKDFTNTIKSDVSYSKLFDKSGFWKPNYDSLSKEFGTSGYLNFGNVGTKNVSMFVVRATDTESALLTQEWEETLTSSALEVEDYPGLNPYMKLRDTFVTVYMFNNDFSKDPYRHEAYGNLFSGDNISVENLNKLVNVPESGFIGKYTGSLIPNLKSEQDINISINDVINSAFMKTGIIADLNEDLLENELQSTNGVLDIDSLDIGYKDLLPTILSYSKGSRTFNFNGGIAIPEDKFTDLTPNETSSYAQQAYVPSKADYRYGGDNYFVATPKAGFNVGDYISSEDNSSVESGTTPIISAEKIETVSKDIVAANAYTQECIAYGDGKYIIIGGGQVFNNNADATKPYDTRWLMSKDLKTFTAFRPGDDSNIDKLDKIYLSGVTNIVWKDIFYNDGKFHVIGYENDDQNQLGRIFYAQLNKNGVCTKLMNTTVKGAITLSGSDKLLYSNFVRTENLAGFHGIVYLRVNDAPVAPTKDFLAVYVSENGLTVKKCKNNCTTQSLDKFTHISDSSGGMFLFSVTNIQNDRFLYVLTPDFITYKELQSLNWHMADVSCKTSFLVRNGELYVETKNMLGKLRITDLINSYNTAGLEPNIMQVMTIADSEDQMIDHDKFTIIEGNMHDEYLLNYKEDTNGYKISLFDIHNSSDPKNIKLSNQKSIEIKGTSRKLFNINNTIIALDGGKPSVNPHKDIVVANFKFDDIPTMSITSDKRSVSETYTMKYDLIKYTTADRIYRKGVPSDIKLINKGQFQTIYKYVPRSRNRRYPLECIVLNSYIPREAQFTNGSSVRQSEILDNMNKEWFVRGCKSINGLRYIVDAFKSFVQPNYKYQFGRLAEQLDERNVFVTCILNDIFVRDLANSQDPLFAQYPGGDFDYSYLPQGGNKQYSTVFLEKLTEGADKCFFFGPGNIRDGILSGVAGRVSNLFYQKTFDFDVIANTTGYISINKIETQIDDRDRMYLEKFRYNPIINYDGLTIFGNFTAQKKRSAQQQIHNAELLVYIKTNLLRIGKSSVFDKGIYSEYLRTKTEVDTFMQSLAYASAIQPNFKAKCDFENNTQEIAANKIKLIDVEYTPVNALDKVVFNINIV